MSRYSQELKQGVLKRTMLPESQSVAGLARNSLAKAEEWDSPAKFAVVLGQPA